jgi:hypothetical protein
MLLGLLAGDDSVAAALLHRSGATLERTLSILGHASRDGKATTHEKQSRPLL